MRGLILGCAGLFASAAQLASVSGAQAQSLDFEILNNTRATIQNLRVRQSGSGEEWSEDLLGADVVSPSRSHNLNNVGDGPPCMFDVHLTMRTGPGLNQTESVSWNRLNLCVLLRMTVNQDADGYIANWRNVQ